jgi:hypothetical protein
MQDAGEFVAEYLRNKWAVSEAVVKMNQPIRERFLAPGFSLLSDEATLEMQRSERVLEVKDNGEYTDVITSGSHEATGRMKYRLERTQSSWQICGLAWQCFMCKRKPERRATCKLCQGTGWRDFGSRGDSAVPRDT